MMFVAHGRVSDHEGLIGCFGALFSTVENRAPIFSCVLGCKGLMLDGTLERPSAANLGHMFSAVSPELVLCC